MSPPSIKVVLPLADAHTNRRTGGKAICLSRLIAARFAVPKGFVLSADAYRSHLWASGARETASAQAEAEEREAVRAAILAQPIPQDIWQLVAEAYERLSWQIGIADPKVAVRSSALEDSRGGAGFPGAYESYLNVSGLENLDAAIKRVWASLWSGKAAAYRARFGSPTEPAMGVIVQQMVESELEGSAFTANPVTGDPHSVGVIVRRGEGQSSQFAVDLSDFSVTRADAVEHTVLNQVQDDGREVQDDGVEVQDDKVGDGEREAIVKAIAEQSILVEDAIGARAEIEWAFERRSLWILQAGPITELPPYFPAELPGNGVWARDDARTISHFARSLIVPAENDPKRVLINGYLYSRQSEPGERVERSERSLGDWEKRAPALRERAVAAIWIDPTSLEAPALGSALKAAAEDFRVAYDWTRRAEQLSVECARALGTIIEDPALLQRTLGGIQDVTFERDALLQELSERFAIAESSGKLEDEKWWRAYKADVEQFAREYGYSFKTAGEAADPSRWRSWIEDPDSVFRMIGAVSKRGAKPTLVTLHSAAEQDSVVAEAEVLAQLGAKQSHLKRVLELARGWLRARGETEHVCALAGTALRQLVMEFAARFENAGLILSREDIFRLHLEEVVQTADSAKQKLAATIARRKHEEWLERRLAAPARLPIEDNDQSESAQQETKLSGISASAGAVPGRARVVSIIEEAAEIENGDILVTASASAAWTPFLALAGGLVCETGSEFSPSVILARIYGIPAVIGCRGALSSIKDGQRITVDGTEGTVSG